MRRAQRGMATLAKLQKDVLIENVFLHVIRHSREGENPLFAVFMQIKVRLGLRQL